jgi:hypothetical protein
MVTQKGSDSDEEDNPWRNLDPLPIQERDVVPWRAQDRAQQKDDDDDWAAVGLDYGPTEEEPDVVVADAAQDDEPQPSHKGAVVVTSFNAGTAEPSNIEQPCPKCGSETKGLIDECTSCGYRFNAAANAPSDVQKLGDEIQEILMPRIVNVWRGGRGPEGARRRDAKKALQRAIGFKYKSITDRYDNDPQYRQNFDTNHKDRRDAEEMDKWAIAYSQGPGHRSKQEIYEQAQKVWKDHRGHAVDTNIAQLEASATKCANATRRYDRYKRITRNEREEQHRSSHDRDNYWYSQQSGDEKGNQSWGQSSSGTARSARDTESWSKGWW